MSVRPAFDRLAPERREKLIDTAIELYLAIPFEQITIRMLVERLQINMNTFYRYFETKDDLFLYIYHSIMEKVLPYYDPDKLLEGFQDPPGGVLSEGEQRFIRLGSLPDSIMHRMYFEAGREAREIYRNALERKRELGLLQSGVDIDLISYMYVTTGYNLMMYWKERSRGEGSGDEGRNLTEEWTKMKQYFYFRFFNYGILNREEA